MHLLGHIWDFPSVSYVRDKQPLERRHNRGHGLRATKVPAYIPKLSFRSRFGLQGLLVFIGLFINSVAQTYGPTIFIF